MQKLLPLLLLSVCSLSLFGQSAALSVTQIDSIVKQTDTVCISAGISDFSLHKKGQKKITLGGGADWFYTDTAGTRLLKAVREMSLNEEHVDTYYFFNDSLVFVRSVDYSYQGDKRVLTGTRLCYFLNGTLLLKQDNVASPFYPKAYIETARSFFTGSPVWRRKL